MQLISKSGLVVLISLTVCGLPDHPDETAGRRVASFRSLSTAVYHPGSYARVDAMTYEQEVNLPGRRWRAPISSRPAGAGSLYVHGCTELEPAGQIYRELLTGEGYAIFVPNSFARRGGNKCGGGPLAGE